MSCNDIMYSTIKEARDSFRNEYLSFREVLDQFITIELRELYYLPSVLPNFLDNFRKFWADNGGHDSWIPWGCNGKKFIMYLHSPLGEKPNENFRTTYGKIVQILKDLHYTTPLKTCKSDDIHVPNLQKLTKEYEKRLSDFSLVSLASNQLVTAYESRFWDRVASKGLNESHFENFLYEVFKVGGFERPLNFYEREFFIFPLINECYNFKPFFSPLSSMQVTALKWVHDSYHAVRKVVADLPDLG